MWKQQQSFHFKAAEGQIEIKMRVCKVKQHSTIALVKSIC